jgi:ABC-2 type transport system ATP-binding protein
MITIERLQKNFGSVVAVDIENLNISKGEIVGLVGNNGAGKTTLLRLMLDLLKPNRGTVFSNNKPVYQSDHWKKFTRSYLEDNFLIEFLKAEEYFDFIGYLYGLKSNDVKLRLEVFKPIMNGEIFIYDRYIRDLSAGNKQKVGIIGALISKPEVLILDEPFSMLDPSSQLGLKLILGKFHEESTKTIIISSHNLNHVSDLCSRVILMEKGKIIKDCKTTCETMNEIDKYFIDQLPKDI